MSAPDAKRTPADRSGYRSFPLVMLVFVGLLVVGVGLGFVIHGRYVAFERTVARHVPGDVPFVVRWDVEKVTLFEPTRRYLLPLLDAVPDAGPAPDGVTRRQRFARESGLDIGRDLREVLALIGPGERDWAIVLGGSFPKAGVMGALEKVLVEEGQSVRRLGGDTYEASHGVAFGRGSDGVLAVASSRDRLDKALAVRQLHDAIPRTGAGALLVRADAPLPHDVRGLLGELGDVARVEALANWGSPLVVDVTVHYRGSPPHDALERGRRALAELMGPGAVPPTELVSGGAPAGPRVTFRIRLNDEALERAARRAGDSVHGTLWRESRKSTAP